MISLKKLSGFSLLATALIFLCGVNAHAGEGQHSNKLSKKIAKAHNNGVEFQPVTLFTDLQNKSYDYLTSSKTLQPKYDAIHELYLEHPKSDLYKILYRRR